MSSINNTASASKAEHDFPRAFLRTLFGKEFVSGGLALELRCIRDNEPIVRRWYRSLAHVASDWTNIAQLNTRGYNIHFGVVLRRHSTAKLPKPLILPCLWVDIDVGPDKPNKTLKAALRRVRKLTKPTIIVKSGHGIHAYWCFKKPTILEPSDATELLRAIVEKTGGDNQAAEVARLLRMPNTINWKDVRR